MKKVKIAQIGVNSYSHGSQVWKSITKQTDIFDVVGYALPEREREISPKKMNSLLEGYREMTVVEILNDPEIEAVVIETDKTTLAKYSLIAAQAGKHVHMEKPGSPVLAEFEAMIEELRARNLVFSIGYMYRFNPKFQEVLARVKSDELGEIYSIEAHMSCYHPEGTRKWLGECKGGMLFYLGCHLVDLIYQIQGEPSEVIPLSCSTNFNGISSEDYGMVVFKYPNGISFAKSCATERGGFLRRQLVICGEKGTIELKPFEEYEPGGLMHTGYGESTATKWHEPWNVGQTDAFDRYDGMMRNFAELIRGKENPYGYDYELNVYKLLMKACRNEQ